MDVGKIAWIVTTVCIVAAWAMQLINIRAMNRTWDILGGELTAEEDLWAVRTAINTSMMLAVVYLGMSVGYFFFLIASWATSALSFGTAGGNVFLFGVLTLPAGLAGKHFENKIRRLDTSDCSNAVAEIYFHWLELWNKPGFRLPD